VGHDRLAEHARYNQTATLLPNGKVLVAGGYNGNNLASAELYDRPADVDGHRLAEHRTVCSHGDLAAQCKVLVAGGFNNTSGYLASVELYDPASGTWTATGSMHTGRFGYTATLLPNGKVLVAGAPAPAGVWPARSCMIRPAGRGRPPAR